MVGRDKSLISNGNAVLKQNCSKMISLGFKAQNHIPWKKGITGTGANASKHPNALGCPAQH